MALGDDIYSGAAEYGKFNALIGVIFGTILAIILIIIGTTLLVHHEEPVQFVEGTITNTPDCKTRQDKDTQETYSKCYIEIAYNINQQKYTYRGYTKEPRQYKNGDKIILYYKPSSPGDAKLTKDWSDHLIGGILLGTGLFIAGGSWLWYYIANKYKFAAAAGGVAGAAELFRR
jgi:uncharacterized protein YxeA